MSLIGSLFGLDIFEYLSFILEGFVLYYLDDLLFSIFQLLDINWLVGSDPFLSPHILSLELGAAGSYLLKSLLKSETYSNCQLEKYVRRSCRDDSFGSWVWVALAETLFISKSSGGMKGTSSSEFQSLEVFQRKSGPFHQRVLSRSSWSPALHKAMTAGLDFVPT